MKAYERLLSYPKVQCHRQSGINLGYVTENGVNSNILIILKPKLFQIIRSQEVFHESIRTPIILCKSIHSKQ